MGRRILPALAAALCAILNGCVFHPRTIAAEHLEIFGLGQFDTWHARGFAIGLMHLTWVVHQGATNSTAPNVFWKVPAPMRYNTTNDLSRE
ncbi:MAG: hypothetical protein DMF62_03180 [Acidobacteria bacterium]|nr:MAG: hypothetical protein DMF62_03180 [Acidobacteriota bacterium]PYT00176.1 MAG: hypothetical protein DMF63_08335 [Acidobacteriota bacterium]